MPIEITETEGVRILKFGTRWVQGAMQIAAPDHLVLQYAQRMSAWLLFHDLDALDGLRLATFGLGAASLTKFAHRAGVHATAVEIDADVIEACRTHFDLPPDGERLQVVHADAAAFAADPANAGRFDVIQVDAFDASVMKPALDSSAFYADCARCLRADGTLVANLFGEQVDLRESVGRLRAALRPRAVWQFPPTQAGNVIVVAHRGETPAPDVLAARGRTIVRRWSLDAPGWLAMARRT